MDQFDLRTRPFQMFDKELLLNAFGPEIEKLSTRIRRIEDYERREGNGPRLIQATFESPGFVTVDATGPIDKLIDILHHGELDKEEQRAIIERISAETELIRAKAAKKKINVLNGAIAPVARIQPIGDRATSVAGRCLNEVVGRTCSRPSSSTEIG